MKSLPSCPAATGPETPTPGARIDLGLALLSVLRRPGERLTLSDIAAWCDCPHQTIGRIEQRALRKLRAALAEAAAAED